MSEDTNKKLGNDTEKEFDGLEFISTESVKDRRRRPKREEEQTIVPKRRHLSASGNKRSNVKRHFHFNRMMIMGVLAIAVVVIAVGISTASYKKHKTQVARQEAQKAEEKQKQNLKTDAVGALIVNYYNALTKGDTSLISSYLKPIDEVQKSYISKLSEHMEAIKNVSSTVTSADEADSYYVTVTSDVKYKNISDTYPEYETFYVVKGSDGIYYIDNAYTDFNDSYRIYKTDASKLKHYKAYKESSEQKKLIASISKKQREVLASSREISAMYNGTIPQQIASWKKENESKLSSLKESVAKGESSEKETTDKTSEDKKNEKEDSVGTDTAKLKGDIHTVSATVSMYSGAGNSNSKITSVPSGSKIGLIQNLGNGWAKVQYGFNIGYIRIAYIN